MLISDISFQILQRTVSQIDLVPTISLLLGSPIPFSSLGTLVTDLFSHCSWWQNPGGRIKQVYHVVKALQVNAHQVRNKGGTEISSLANNLRYGYSIKNKGEVSGNVLHLSRHNFISGTP